MRIKIAVIAIFLAIAASAFAEKKIICYYESWAKYNHGQGKFPITSLDVNLCTHVIYAFVGVTLNGEIKLLDDESDLPLFTKHVKGHGAKALLSVGGYSGKSKKFSDIAADAALRSRFVKSAVHYLQKYNFDGLDVDWEYPNRRGGKRADKHNYILLLKELKNAFSSHHWSLSAAVAAEKDSALESYKIRKVAEQLDFINVMTYDFNGYWNGYTGMNSPLYASVRDSHNSDTAQLNINASIQFWLDHGAPAHKLMLGVPFYGITFTLKDNSNHHLHVPTSGPGKKGPYTNDEGNIGYNEICVDIKNGGWTVVRTRHQKVPYAYKGNQWVSYDDPRSIRHKAAFAKRHNLGGVMIWSVDTDDFHGNCGPKNALLKAVNEVLKNYNTILSKRFSNGWHIKRIEETVSIQTSGTRETSKSTKMFKVAFLVAFIATIVTNVQAETKIVCYFGSWTVYRPGNGKIEIQDINPSLCTHMIYSFVGINTDGTVRIMDAWADLPDGGGKDGFGKFVARSKQGGAKAMIAIGGWNEGSVKFSQVVGNTGTRSTFVQNVVKFLQRYNFDGFDVDWEYPNQRGGQPNDRENFVALLRELRQAFDSHGYTLSVAVGAAEKSASQSYIINQVAQHVHFINLMTYDMNGAWNNWAGLNAPLYPASRESGEQAKLNVDSSVHYWLSQGAPADKLVLGIPSYGRTFTLANPGNNGIGAPASGPGAAGPYTREAGMLGYNEICEFLRQGGWDVRREPQQHVPYAVKGNQWVGYDDVESVREKSKYANSLGLGGAMMWSIETDDFRGICGQRYPLLTVMNEVLRGRVPSDPQPPPNPPPTPKPTPKPPSPPASGICQKEGYVRDPNDCSVFYNCVNQGGKLVPHRFQCPAGTVFDPTIIGCNYKDNVPGC